MLDNIREQLRVNRKHLLEDYFREFGRDLADVYRKTGDYWTSLIREVGLVDISQARDVVVVSQSRWTWRLPMQIGF